MNAYTAWASLIDWHVIPRIFYQLRGFLAQANIVHWGEEHLLSSALMIGNGLLVAELIRQINEGRNKRDIAADELTMLRAVIKNLPDQIYVKDKESKFLLANQGVAEVMGVAAPGDLIGKSDIDYLPAEVAAGFYQDEQKMVRSGQPIINQNEPIMRPNGEVRWNLTTKVPFRKASGEIVGIIGVNRDITLLKKTEAELECLRKELQYKATHDSLTSLLNREGILEMLDREWVRSRNEKSSFVLLLADLDHFKNINDRYGHPVGDEVLRETADRFLRLFRSSDRLGRYGGEEFLAILAGCDAAGALARADNIRHAIEVSPIATSIGSVSVTTSIGVLSVREWGYPRPHILLSEVDKALYAAKAEGRNRCKFAIPPHDSKVASQALANFHSDATNFSGTRS